MSQDRSQPPTPEQRARDGRLAWIIVGVCAVVTLALIVGLVFALRGPMGRWADQTRQQAASSPTKAAGADRQDNVAAAPAARDTPDDGATLQKHGAESDTDAHKTGADPGDGDSSGRTAPPLGDDTPQPRRI